MFYPNEEEIQDINDEVFYSVGDTVTVLDDISFHKNIQPGVAPGMVKMQGLTFRISKVFRNPFGKIRYLLHNDVMGYAWANSLFKEILKNSPASKRSVGGEMNCGER